MNPYIRFVRRHLEVYFWREQFLALQTTEFQNAYQGIFFEEQGKFNQATASPLCNMSALNPGRPPAVLVCSNYLARASQRVEDTFRRKRLMPYFGSKGLQGIIDSNPNRSHRADQAAFPYAFCAQSGR